MMQALVDKMCGVEVATVVTSSQEVMASNYAECPQTWMTTVKGVIDIRVSFVRKHVLEWCIQHETDLEEYTLKFCALEYIVKKLITTIYLSDEPNFDGAFAVLEILKDMIQNTLYEKKSEEYIMGLMFMIHSQQRQLLILSGESENSEMIAKISGISFEELPNVAKATMLAAKLIFCRAAKLSSLEQAKMVREVIVLDSKNHEWQHILFLVLRSIRYDSDETRFRIPPTPSELGALGKAYEGDPVHPEILLSVCKTLLEYLRSSVKRSYVFRQPIKIGSKGFFDTNQMTEYMAETLKNLTDAYPKAIYVNQTAAQILISGRLPENKRDVEFAFSCIDRVLELWPSSADLLHRMGVMMLTERKNFDVAKSYLEKAVVEDPFNFIAVVEYYWILSRHPKVEVVTSIDEKLASQEAERWANHVLMDLLFIKGCALFGLGNVKEAVTAWLKSAQYSKRCFQSRIFSLNGTFARYNWGGSQNVNGNMSLEKIVDLVKDLAESSDENAEVTELVVLLDKTVMEKSRSRRVHVPRQDHPDRDDSSVEYCPKKEDHREVYGAVQDLQKREEIQDRR